MCLGSSARGLCTCVCSVAGPWKKRASCGSPTSPSSRVLGCRFAPRCSPAVVSLVWSYGDYIGIVSVGYVESGSIHGCSLNKKLFCFGVEAECCGVVLGTFYMKTSHYWELAKLSHMLPLAAGSLGKQVFNWPCCLPQIHPASLRKEEGRNGCWVGNYSVCFIS